MKKLFALILALAMSLSLVACGKVYYLNFKPEADEAWQQIGYMMIIYIAGLQAIPEDLNEAAKIDGANGADILFRVTIPNMMPSITICTFLTLINSFKSNDAINLNAFVLPGGDSLCD